jgi:hypothetical protein
VRGVCSASHPSPPAASDALLLQLNALRAGSSSYLDVTSPEACAWWAQQFTRYYLLPLMPCCCEQVVRPHPIHVLTRTADLEAVLVVHVFATTHCIACRLFIIP